MDGRAGRSDVIWVAVRPSEMILRLMELKRRSGAPFTFTDLFDFSLSSCGKNKDNDPHIFTASPSVEGSLSEKILSEQLRNFAKHVIILVGFTPPDLQMRPNGNFENHYYPVILVLPYYPISKYLIAQPIPNI